MSIDLSQFKQTFLEESDEGLDVLESGLLALDNGSADDEVIHSVFRAAHSIKGGAGTFGLSEIASFTHVMETLLDEMRDGRREISKRAISALLSSVDVLREMLEAAADDNSPDMARATQASGELEAILANSEEGAEEDVEVKPDVMLAQDQQGEGEIGPSTGWKIYFKPMEHMLRTGNDTVRILRELSLLGELNLTTNTSDLPKFALLDPEYSYLSWKGQLIGDIDKNDIIEIFEWVDDDCELMIEPLPGLASDNDEAAQVSPAEVKPQEKALEEAFSEPLVELKQEKVQQVAEVAVEKKQVTNPVVAKKEARKTESSSIRVGTDKVDELINMVGELVITQSMLSQLGNDFSMKSLEAMREGLAQLERNTRELQESVMRIRMLPISFSFQRFPRLVYDLSNKMGKKIELKLSGEQTELDKTVMEKIGDPLVHLVRNSLDHGIESPEQRLVAGKPETGLIHLNAYHQGGHIIIEIIDDGAGLPKDKLLSKAIKLGLAQESENLSDEKIYDFIFHPGFSTAEQVTDVSGRGVGMDVVRKNIKALGGNIELSSVPGKGTKFIIRLPLTLAILDGQLVSIGDEVYIIPLVSIIESLEIDTSKISSIAGGNEVYQLREEYIPLLHLDNVFNIERKNSSLSECIMVVVECNNNNIGIVVDDLLNQQQVVIKSLESNYKRVEGISGATILGDGTVALILDMFGLISVSESNTVGQIYQTAS